jgi:hypothetical protein
MGFNTRTVVEDINLYFTKIKCLICLFIKFGISSETAQSYSDSEKVKVSSGQWDPAGKIIPGQFILNLRHVNCI